ncbi:MAG: translation elongation factor Ts [Actinobacteria bacterium]|nr:MAG: translation elongation factor Ts [Actinomycetota bacterium]
MTVTNKQIQELRQATGAGLMDCKSALTEAKADMDKAVEILRLKGLAGLEKRAGRVAKEGIIEAYIHANNKIGVMVEVNCETDFVARNDKFKEFAHDIALQIAASAPLYVNEEDVPSEVLSKEKKIYKEQAKAEGKPDKVLDKIVEGKVKKYYEEVVLLNQSYVKNPDITILDYLGSFAGSIGENIRISRFVRLELGNA